MQSRAIAPSHRAAIALAALVIVAASLAACTGDDTSDRAATSDRTVTVTMTDNAYMPASISAKEGELVTFKFVNDGTVTHEAYIGSDQDQENHAAEMARDDSDHAMHMEDTDLVTVDPGDNATITKDFSESGTVVIGCHEPGHWEAGMKATVTVS